MRLDEIIQQHTEKLSPHLQAEVYDFVLFLEQKQASTQLTTDPQQRKERLRKALDNAVALGVFAGIDGSGKTSSAKHYKGTRNVPYETLAVKNSVLIRHF